MTSNLEKRLRELVFIKICDIEKKMKTETDKQEIYRLTCQYQHLRGFLATYNKI